MPQSSKHDLRHWLTDCGWPAWMSSLVLHSTAAAAIGLSFHTAPQGAAPEATREGGIVLVSRAGGQAKYFADELPSETSAATAEVVPPAEIPPLVGGLQLPVPPVGAGSAPVASEMPSVLPPHQAGSGGIPGRAADNAVETQVFGVTGKGTKFVYVFDRSSSMEGPPLLAAKRELIASLQSLRSVHQFQIVFYNQTPRLLPAFRGTAPQLAFADEPGKRLAANFIGGIMADGPTDHMQALAAALRLHPDVIFFLTDADEPQLSNEDFQRVSRLNQGSLINAIEFGVGPPKARFSFLVKLAAENGGRHTYVDVTRLTR